MNKLMTTTEYEARRDDLRRAFTLAEAEFQNESFKRVSGQSDDAKVEAARNHMETVARLQEEHDAAWTVTQAKAVENLKKRANDQFEGFLAEAEGLLEKRKLALDAAMTAADAVLVALAQYTAASEDLLAKSVPFHGRGSKVRQDAVVNLMNSLCGEAGSALAAVSTMFYDAGVKMNVERPSRDHFGEQGPHGHEEQRANEVRRALQVFAPGQGEHCEPSPIPPLAAPASAGQQWFDAIAADGHSANHG